MKKFIIHFYKILRGLQVLLNLQYKKNKYPNVFYGGAIKGNIGGTLVKIKRLNTYFPEHLFTFNIVYVLSNSPYLPSFALKILKKRKIPIIHNQNGVFYPAWYTGNYKLQNTIIANQYKKADHIFFQSKFCKSVSEKFLGKCNANNEILYNAVDTKKFYPIIKNKNNYAEFTFLITGKFSIIHYYHIKNTIISINNFKHKKINLKFNIAGTITSQLKSKINILLKNINVKKNKINFLGKYTQEIANAIYNDADAFVYLSHNSPCPNSVIEAMSCGLPVLYSNSGGVPELVGLKCGVPLNVKNSFDIAYCPNIKDIQFGIKKIIENKNYFSKNARNRAIEMFDIENWILAHKRVFNHYLSNKI